MKKLCSSIIMICFLIMLTGCWGAKEIQSQTYITGLGLDFSEGHFIVYTQALNFSNIAKLEGGSALQQPSPIFIGEAKGKTIHAAISKLEQNAALPLYYGHVSTLLLRKSIIKEKMKSVIEFGQNPYLDTIAGFLGQIRI
jgi:spore germination protein KC